VIALIVGGLIAVAAVVIVALPFLRETGAAEFEETTPAREHMLALLEGRDRALAALKELEFDHRTGKVDDTDYRALVGPLRRAAAEALQSLDRLKAGGSAEQGVPEQEDVERDDDSGDQHGGGGGAPLVDEQPHDLAPGSEADERDQREGDPEGEHHL